MNGYAGLAIKQYVKHFKVILIIFAVFLTLFIVTHIGKFEKAYYPESTNYERVYGDQRVFDYGCQLNDEEEEKLTEHIHEAELKTGYDIVIVTLNQSLKNFAPEYMANYSINITPDRYVMVYADKFWEDNKFGYDCPQVLDGTQGTGDGIILVDNLYREDETGKIYTWMGTTGKAETAYSTYAINEALDVFYENVDYDYYRACNDFVDRIVWDSKGMKGVYKDIYSGFSPYFIAAVVALVYFLVKRKGKSGAVTVTAESYITGRGVDFSVKEDTFLRKTVTKHYNPPSSSSGSGGGGGHHSSGGGGSHGGGGHSR